MLHVSLYLIIKNIYKFLKIIYFNLHFAVSDFLNLSLKVVESNSGPSIFSFSSNYSDSVGNNSSADLRNFAKNKSI